MRRILLIISALAITVGASAQEPPRPEPQQPALRERQAQQLQRTTEQPLPAAPQQARRGRQTVQYQTVTFLTTLTCDNCRQRIEASLPYQRGVTDVVVDVPSKRVRVTFNPERTNVETLVEAFHKLGYEANVVE